MRVAADVSELKTNMEKAVSYMETAGKAIVAAWSIERVVGTVATFAGEIVNTAGAMVDLSAKTGLSLDTIQRMEFVAGQTNATLDDFTTAAYKLGQNIAGGDGSVRSAVERLGLSFNVLRAQRPDQQFETIATALRSVTNEQQRNAIAADLFGKTAQPIMSAIAQGYADIARQARVAGDAQVHALDDAGDAWDKFVSNRKKDATDLLGSFVLAGEGAGKIGIVNVLDLIMKQGPLATQTLAALGAAARETGKDINLPAPPVDPLISYRQHLDDLRAAMKALTPAQQELVREGQRMGESTKTIADGLGVSEQAVKAFVEAEQEAEAASQRFKKVADDWAKLWADMHQASVKMIDALVADTNKAARDMADEIVRQQLKLRELAGEAQAANAALYNQGGGSGLDSALAANEADRAKKLSDLHLGTLNLNDPNSLADIERTKQIINGTYDQMFNDIVTKAGTMSDNVAGAIAAGEPKIASAAATAAGSVSNNFLQVFGNVEFSAAQMADSVTRTLNAMRMDQAYEEAGFFIDHTGPVAQLNATRAKGRTTAGMPHLATGGIVTGPTVALIGEKGPEAVVPLDRAHTGLGGIQVTVNIAAGAADGPGAAARKGREAGDALIAQLRARGVRL